MLTMNLTAIIRKSADYFLRDYLDAPTPPSLEMLSAEGEREQVKIEDTNCFVYVLLSYDGKRYSGSYTSFDGKRYSGSYTSGSGFSIPSLPKIVSVLKPTFRYRMRKIVRSESGLQDLESIETALQEALTESGIIEYREGIYGIFGITEPELRHLLYIPAETAGEADQKLDRYRQRVNSILQPHRLQCARKIKPLLKPGNIKQAPESLKDSYFGAGC